MYRNRGLSAQSGATLLDTLVGVALMVIVFVGISGAFRLSLEVVSNNKARAGAIALANERMEYLQSLSYDDVGTSGGIPSGTVAQNENVTLNGVPYIRHTLVRYADDPKDGSGASDSNGIIADYKEIKTDVSWSTKQGGSRTITLVGRVSPPGLETAVSGGTLSITVVNSSASPVVDAQVSIVNASTSPAIDITAFTNASGTISFIGAPASSRYQIVVTKSGYSTARTYTATSQNTSPTPGDLTVANNQTTSSTFAIDLLSTKTVETYHHIRTATTTDLFADESRIATSTNISVAGGSAQLADDEISGSLQSTTIEPGLLVSWKQLSWIDSEPSGSSIRYRVYDSTGTSLIPDVSLPGNSVGFTTSPINLVGIATTTYSGLRLVAEFTPGSAASPSIDSLSVSYEYGPEQFGPLAFSMRGTKTIGTGPSGTIYKYPTTALTTNASGSLSLSSLEWDTYLITVGSATGYDIASSCTAQPEALTAGASQTTRVYVLPYSTNSLLVDVKSSSGEALTGATIRLQRVSSGYDKAQTSDWCAHSLFSSLSSGTVATGNAYTITVSKSGYQNYTSSAVNVSGTSALSVVLNP